MKSLRTRHILRSNLLYCILGILFAGTDFTSIHAEHSQIVRNFIEQHCIQCHDLETKEGGLDLVALLKNVDEGSAFGEWVKIHDRVRDGEMPPKTSEPVDPNQRTQCLIRLCST